MTSRRPAKPELVIFDLDNTLCDHRTSLLLRLEHAFTPTFPDEEQRASVVHRSVMIATDGTSHFEELLAEHGVTDPLALQAARTRYVSDRFRGLRLFDDTLETIDAVRDSFVIAMITNGPTEIQQAKLDLLGIEPLFSFVLISESTGYWKPDPRIFELALDRTGTPAHLATYVGDSPDHDIAGAQSAGLSTIWMNRWCDDWPGGTSPDYEVRDLSSVVEWLGL